MPTKRRTRSRTQAEKSGGPAPEIKDPCPHEPKCTKSNLTVTKMGSLPRAYDEGSTFATAIYKMIKDYPWICFRGEPCVPNSWLTKKTIQIPGSTTEKVVLPGNLVDLMSRESGEILGRDQLVYKLGCTEGVGLKMKQNGIVDYYKDLWQRKKLKLSFVSAKGLINYLTDVSSRQRSWTDYRASHALAEESEDDEEYEEDLQDLSTSDEEMDEEDDEQYNQERKRPPRARTVVSPNSQEEVQNARVLEIFDRAAPLDSVRFRYLVEDLVRFFNHTYSLPMPFNANRAQIEISKQKLAALDASRPGFVSRVEPIERRRTLLEEEEEEDAKEVEGRGKFRIVTTYRDPRQTEESIFETKTKPKAVRTPSRSRQTQAANRQREQRINNILDSFKNNSKSLSDDTTTGAAARGREGTVEQTKRKRARVPRSAEAAATRTDRMATIMQPNVGKRPILIAKRKQARVPSMGTTTIGFNNTRKNSNSSGDTVKLLQPKKKKQKVSPADSPNDRLKRVQAINRDTGLTEEKKKELLAIERDKFLTSR